MTKLSELLATLDSQQNQNSSNPKPKEEPSPDPILRQLNSISWQLKRIADALERR